MSMNIMDVAENNFEKEVIEYSKQKPVVVDFWAPWCQPCRMLSPLLERLTDQGAGSFRLAKINVDENPALANLYGVQGIPAVKGFRDGQVVGEFVGAQPEAQVRKFLTNLVPSPAENALREIESLLAVHRWEEAERAAHAILSSEPQSGAAALLLVRAYLSQGKGEQALEVLDGFPPAQALAAAERLRPLAEFLAEPHSSQDDPINEMEAGYLQSARLAGRGNFPAALDGLLGLLRLEKHYRADSARKVFLAILELMGDTDPLTREYRNELASILF
jgi:putative thioredoxin